MSRKSTRILVVFCFLILLYLLGPSPQTPKFSKDFPHVPAAPQTLTDFVESNEKQHKLKPNNQARIVWFNESIKTPTEYAIVYLHGFSASQEEGNPVHQEIAKKFGCNLYLSRLAEHGIDTTEQLLNLTADKLWESSKMALAIGLRLGKKVILMGTSTGGTLALKLAAAYPESVAGLVLYSPNIEINDPAAFLINNSWGLQLARVVKGGKYVNPHDNRAIYKQYWNSPYRLEAVAELQELLELGLGNSTFHAIHQPVLSLYYYEDENHQDPVVKVSAMKAMMHELATPQDKKREIAMTKVKDHVLASPIRSGDVAGVSSETERFFKEVMLLKKVNL
jgi:esterase/lipase